VDTSLGIIRSIWQAKKYSQRNRVRLSEVRELSAIREDAKASKALVVTTSKLTRDAIAWVRRDQFRMGYMEHDALTDWIRRAR
jgi:restriction endonuclease Mrr